MKDAAPTCKHATDIANSNPMEMRLEVVVIPVSDVDRAKAFYTDLGWRLDLDHAVGDDYRVIQFTPSGSGCSVIFGKNVTAALPGTAQGMHLIVSDIQAVCNELHRRGIDASEPFHDEGGVFHHSNGKCIANGINPDRKSYASYATVLDPDGNGWIFQEVTARLPGQRGDTSFTTQLYQVVWGGDAIGT
ncbi:catechol 2,3-dioxygenase-like lactoylglutathione lyase family enzyme [Phyllobacterium sp. 1468]|uniref:VOC family protein n=1 Tax=Phyllobacterium sp. 1468 TaxID=2817759 RepID=UPI00285DBEA0|nr:VOC family protein [Phyllobacterium sp. 1468]MDR6635112.1 catechol 2,3-dioxygenase-like lactoylglutathione lyase family enzyme [Phyllobacterium sp. 1468]